MRLFLIYYSNQLLTTIIKYIRAFAAKEFNAWYMLCILLLLAVIIYLNYWHGLEKRYAAPGKAFGRNFIGYYCLYLVPFAAAFFLQRLFYPDCSYFSNAWFWIILLLAPAFFAFRVSFQFHQPIIEQRWPGNDQLFWLKSISWVLKVLLLLIPVFIVWWIKDRDAQPFYGSQSPGNLKPYLLMVLIMVPLLLLAATQKDFQQVYPKAQILAGKQLTGWHYLLYELCYGFDFISIEFFFRGFLILALVQICGTHCIIPAACFYCSIHLGKPMGEAISSFWGGLLLGIIAYNTGSVWGGLVVHLGIAWLMELSGWLIPELSIILINK